jgi:micrococcal nuclease
MGTFLVLTGLFGLLFGLVNVVYPLGKWRVTTRKRGGAVLGSSFALMLIGGLLLPPVDEPAEAATPSTTTTVPVVETTTTTVIETTTTPTRPSTTTSTTTTVPLPEVPQAGVLFSPPVAGSSGDPGASLPAGSESMTVTGITDGDTISVRLPSGARDVVRLIGINTPESGECFSDEAALILSSLIPVGSTIGATADVSDRDQFDRLLRYLWVGGMSVNEELVRRGAALARPYPPDTSLSSPFATAQDEASSAGLGLWEADACGPQTGAAIEVMSVLADAPGSDTDDLNGEYVTIRNGGPTGTDLSGWVLKDESASHRYQFPAGFVLASGAALEVRTGCGTDTPTTLYWCNGGAVWNNDGDTAFVTDQSGNIVDSWSYEGAVKTAASPATTVAPEQPVPPSAPPEEPSTSGCHPSYTGACVPIVSDVDCKGGSGDGPEYVGRVNVVGDDEYGLDRDGDGVACDG